MVDGAETTPGAAPGPSAAGGAEPGSELEAQLAALKEELATTRAQIRSLRGEAAQQSELEKLQVSLDRARKERDRLLGPPAPKEPKPELTVEEVLKQQIREARQQIQALKANPDKEVAELRQKLLKAQRELELARAVQDSQAVQQARAISAELANLRANLQGATATLKRQTGLATIEAIAAEVGAVQRELGAIQSTLTLSRLQMGLVLVGVCWLAISFAEVFHLSRLAWERLGSLPGIGLLQGENGSSDTAMPATATPLLKGDQVAGYRVTSGFGPRVPPCAGCSGEHRGIDLNTPISTPVHAPYAASVECKGGLGDAAGNYAVLKPKAGGPQFLLLHLDTCQAGEAKPGQQVGTSGNTGNGTGPHLDVRQIESGIYVNPTKEWVERIITGKVPAVKSSKTPSSAADFIAKFEGFHSTPYWDVSQYTWGYGTRAPGPTGTINQEQAKAELHNRIAQDSQTIDRLVRVPLTEGQRTALISFQFNTGGLEGSQLLARLNAGDYLGAATEFGRWVHANGQVLPGLVDRRAAERALFLGG